MPVTVPFTLEVKFTPSSTLDESPESTVAGFENSKIVSSGVTAADAVDAGLGPFAFVAVTVNVYGVPFVKPVTGVLVAGAFTVTGVPAVEPEYGVTVYEVMELPPLLEGAPQDTSAWLDPGIAATPVGAVGGPPDPPLPGLNNTSTQ
jgi:hypothetical protein